MNSCGLYTGEVSDTIEEDGSIEKVWDEWRHALTEVSRVLAAWAAGVKNVEGNQTLCSVIKLNYWREDFEAWKGWSCKLRSGAFHFLYIARLSSPLASLHDAPTLDCHISQNLRCLIGWFKRRGIKGRIKRCNVHHSCI
jgi:hypothetical protein